MKAKSYITAALFAALAGSLSVQAAPVVGSDGVNMGNVTAGRIFNAKDLTPNTVGLWTSNAAWARTVAPVANFTGVGFDPGGAAFNVLYANLIPLKTSSVRVVDPTGANVFNVDASGAYFDDLYLKDSSGNNLLLQSVNGELLLGGVSMKGAKGDKGDPGTNGINGTDGAKGDKGDKGDPGNPATDDQTLLVSGNTLSISGGNSVTLPGAAPYDEPFRNTGVGSFATSTSSNIYYNQGGVSLGHFQQPILPLDVYGGINVRAENGPNFSILTYTEHGSFMSLAQGAVLGWDYNALGSPSGGDRLLISAPGQIDPTPMIALNEPNAAGSRSMGPFFDNNVDLGSAGLRWRAVYSVNGAIQTSDLRLKKNIADLGYGIDDVMKMRPVRFQWKDGSDEKKIGFIAQEMNGIVPEVITLKDDRYGMNYAELTPVLVKAVQDQQQMIREQQTEIAQLREEIASFGALASRLRDLETIVSANRGADGPETVSAAIPAVSR